MRRAQQRTISLLAALALLAVAADAAAGDRVDKCLRAGRLLPGGALPCAQLAAQPGAASTGAAAAKQAFVSALMRFLEAAAGTYGDEGAQVRTSLDSMQAAMVAWDTAIRRMESAVPVETGIEARFALGVAYLNRLRPDEALRHLAAANAIDDRHPEVHVLSAIVHSLRERHAEAVEALASASRLGPEDPSILYRLALSLQRLGRNEDAHAVLRRFVDVQKRRLAQPATVSNAAPFVRVDLLRQVPGAAPIFPPAWYADGMVALGEGRLAEAIDLLRTAAAADPLTVDDHVAAERMRDGAAALRRGALATAIGHFTGAIALEPQSSEAYRLAGMAYWADEQYDRSIDHLQKAIPLNTRDDRARVALAEVFAAAGRVTEAEQVLRDAVKVMPESGLAQYRLGRLLYEFPEMWPDAMRAFEAAIRLHPVIGSDLLYQRVAHMHLVALDFEAAVDASGRRIEANPNHADAYRVLAEAYVQHGRDRDAIPQYLAALLVDPRDARSWAALAQSQLRTGEYAEAVSAARRAIQIENTNVGAQFALANALIRLGRGDEGARALERFQHLQAEAQVREAREWELKMLNQEAAASLQRGEQERAIAALRASVALAPNVAAGYVSLGVVLKSARRHAEAIEQFRKALELSADSTACRLLVESHDALGLAEDAARYRVDCARMREERVKAGSWRR